LPISAATFAHARRIAEPRPAPRHSFLGRPACGFALALRASSFCTFDKIQARLAGALGFGSLILEPLHRRGHDVSFPTRNAQQESLCHEANCIPGAVKSTGLKTRHYRDPARLKSCPPILMEFRCEGGYDEANFFVRDFGRRASLRGFRRSIPNGDRRRRSGCNVRGEPSRLKFGVASFDHVGDEGDNGAQGA